MFVYIYIYMEWALEGSVEVGQRGLHGLGWDDNNDANTTVGFHNFNLRIVNMRVSNPNKLTVDVFLTRCRISMCQGLGPKKHDDISEIDRNTNTNTDTNTNNKYKY